MSATPERESTSPRKPARWKAAVRIVVALALLGAVLWFVPWSDRLSWPERFGDAPLEGRIVERDDAVEFTVEDGEGDVERVVLRREAGRTDGDWARTTIVRRDGATEEVELEAAARLQLAQQPERGLRSTLARLSRKPLSFVYALLLYVAGAMLSFQRWQVLLRAVHVDARFWRVQKLGFLGLFFSNIIPGMTGGDLVKAIMVARDHPEQRPAAVLSVIVDRAIGLFGLALVASGVLLFQQGRFEEMARKLNLILLAILVCACVVLSRRLRRAIRLDKLLAKLPFAEVLRKLDRAALLYREARGALVYSVAVSLVIHLMILTAIAVLGSALGIHIRFADYYALVPLALIAQSLPLTPGGVGVGEAAFVYLFQKAGVASAAALTLSFSYRAIQLLVSVVGGLLLLTRHERRPSDKEMQGGDDERPDRDGEGGGGAAAVDEQAPVGVAGGRSESDGDEPLDEAESRSATPAR